jgi:hypothetical protein
MRGVKDINIFRVGDRVGFKRNITMSQLFAVKMGYLELDDVGTIVKIIDDNYYRVIFDRTIGYWTLEYTFNKDWGMLKTIKHHRE